MKAVSNIFVSVSKPLVEGILLVLYDSRPYILVNMKDFTYKLDKK